MEAAFDRYLQEIADKKVLLLEEDMPFARRVAASIKEQLGCGCDIVRHIDGLKKLFHENPDVYFIGVFNYVAGNPTDTETIDFALSHGLPVIVLTQEYDNDTREILLSKEIVDFILKRSDDDISYLVQLIKQTIRNKHMRILVVDDSAFHRAVMADLLKTQQYDVELVTNAHDALEKMVDPGNIDVVLADYIMPGMDGYEMVTRMRKRYKKDELAIIAVSGDTSDVSVSKFLKFGANDYIKKPFSKEEFICRVNNNVEYLELIRLQKELTNFDFLSGLHNRKYLYEVGQTLYANATRDTLDLCIGMMDIDNFKSVNDRYGHDVGDLVIQDFAARLRGSFRSSDVLCRYGGEEFCVILLGVEDAYIESTFHKFLESVRSARIVTKQKEVVSYTVSIGVCATLLEGFESMVKCADEAMYTAKKEGKNRIITDFLA